MRYLLIPNTKKEEAVRYAKRAEDLLYRMDGVCVAKDPSEADCIVTFGGDGTIIRAARDFAEYHLPLLGINLGTLGFLAEVSKDRMAEAFSAMEDGAYLIQEHRLVHGKVMRDREVIHESGGLNDIVLHSADPMKMIRYELRVNGERLYSYGADGVIVSTPTGSTAYNLSAGGPVAMPSADLIIVTPVNAHTMMQRSLVLPASVTLTIRLEDASEDGAVMNFDSDRYGTLRTGDEIVITKGEQKVRFIKFREDSFVEVLRTRMIQ